MRAGALILSVVVALGGGYFVYAAYLAGNPAGTRPQQQVDVIGIRSELQVIGQAERQYLVTHSTYASLAELQEADLLPPGADRRGYVLSDTVDGSQKFTITATPSDPDKAGWPTLAIDETMQITSR
jgi:hypothetical protein